MGPSLTFLSKEKENGCVFGFGAGLQPTFSLAGGGLELYLEPRLDLYEKEYAVFHGISHNWKLVGSMLAGLNITNGASLTRKEVRERNHAFKNLRFFELIGRASLAALTAARCAFSTLRILAAA